MEKLASSNRRLGLFYLLGLLVIVVVSQPGPSLQLFYRLESLARMLVSQLLKTF